MTDTLKPLDLEAIVARDAAVYAGRSLAGRPFVLSSAEEDRHALVAEVKRLREALKNIRDIKEYTEGRPCACSGVGCVQCIARLTLEGREGELFS